MFVEKVLYKNVSSAQNAEFHMVHLERRTFREKVLPQQWGLLLEWWSPSSSSSRLRLDSVDRPCGDVSVTGTASRAARKSRCAVLKVVIRDYKCQYWYGLLKMTLSWFWRLQNRDKTRKFKKRRSQDIKKWSSWSCSCLWSCWCSLFMINDHWSWSLGAHKTTLHNIVSSHGETRILDCKKLCQQP